MYICRVYLLTYLLTYYGNNVAGYTFRDFFLSIYLSIFANAARHVELVAMLLSPASAGPSTEADLARLLELAGTPVRPSTPQQAPAGAPVEATSSGLFTPPVESGCQAEAGSTPPGVVESVAACRPGPAAAVQSAQGERRCEEPLRPLLATRDGQPHHPAEHGRSDARQLCAAVCSSCCFSALEATAATKPSRPERPRARVVAFALVAAAVLAAVVVLGSVLGARPARPRPPPPAAFTPSSLEASHLGSSRLGSSHPPGGAAVRAGAAAPHAAAGHSGHKRAGGGGASSSPPSSSHYHHRRRRHHHHHHHHHHHYPPAAT